MGSTAVVGLTFIVCGIFVLAKRVDTTVLFFSTMCLIVISGLSIAVFEVRETNSTRGFDRYVYPVETTSRKSGRTIAGSGYASVQAVSGCVLMRYFVCPE